MKSQPYLRQGPYDFNPQAIKSIPERCGVFAVFNEELCVRVGMASNLRRRILKLCERPDDCVKQHWPTSVEIDVCTAFEVEKRWAMFKKSLVLQKIYPVCGLEA